MSRLLVTGGAGFIGATVVTSHAIDGTDHNVVVVDKLTYAGNLESLAPVSSQYSVRLRSGGHCRSAKYARGLSKISARHRDALGCGKAMLTDQSMAQGILFESRYCRDLFRCFRLRLITGVVYRRISRTNLGSTIFQLMRSLALWARRFFQRNDGIQSELPLFGIEGSVRPSCTRLATHLWLACADQQLL